MIIEMLSQKFRLISFIKLNKFSGESEWGKLLRKVCPGCKESILKICNTKIPITVVD